MKFDDKAFIAKKVKMHRKKIGYTQEQLAEQIDLSVQHVSRLENGCYVPSLATFFKIVSVLDIDLKEFGYNIEKHKNPIINDLVENITNASDAELIFYENMFKSIKDSFSKINKRNNLMFTK